MTALIEFFFGIAMFVNAMLFIPQAVKIYQEKSALNLSLVTFGGFNLIQLATILHGWLHQDWYIVAGIGVSFLTCSTITVQILFAMWQSWKCPANVSQK